MRVFSETVAGILALAFAVWFVGRIVEMKHARERAAEVARK